MYHLELLLRVYQAHKEGLTLVGWLVILRINVDLAIFQPYFNLEKKV